MKTRKPLLQERGRSDIRDPVKGYECDCVAECDSACGASCITNPICIMFPERRNDILNDERITGIAEKTEKNFDF